MLLLGGVFVTLLAYIYRDQLVLDRTNFAFWIATLRISSFALLLFLVATLIALGRRFISERLYALGVFLIPSLIPDLFHILSFVFFPDFITKNTRNKVAYLFLLSKSLVLLAFYISAFYPKVKTYIPLKSYRFLTAFSLVASFGIVMFHPYLPPLYLEGIGQTWHRDAFDAFSIILYSSLALYVVRNKVFESVCSWYIFTALNLISLSSLSLFLYKNFYDFLIVLASFYRFLAYLIILYAVLYINLRQRALQIMESALTLLTGIIRSKPTKEENIFFLRLDKGFSYIVEFMFLYSLKENRLVAVAHGPKGYKLDGIDLNSIKRLLKDLGGQYFDREYHYSLYEDYLIVSRLSAYPESPLDRLHVINTERIILGYLLNAMNFDKIIEEKAKELERLYLLLETSEYATQAYNNIDTFSKQVLERLDYTLKMDGSVFYMWNKNAELPERVVFSSGFLQNFPDFKLHQLLEKVMESPDMYGAGDKYIYCKFESNSYQSGLLGLRKDKGFDKEEFLFLKTVSNQLFHVVKLMKVIEDLEKAQASIRFLTEYDPLTMLYNRKSFEKLLEDEIERSDRSGEPLCLLFIDVDNFKIINDTYGYHVGDMVLKHVAEVLKKKIRRLDTAGRLGGDEFGVILPKANKGVVEYIAERLRQEILNMPLAFGDTEIRASLSVGIVCYPLDAKNKEEILSLGEALMHAIKREGKGRVKTVEESVKEIYTSFRRIERKVLESLEKASIEVFLQDIVNLSTEKVEGFEALMRLKVDDELLPASRFINIAEDMGLVQKLDIAMIEGLFQKIAYIKDNSDILLFINLSPQDLTHDFIKDVVQRARTYGVETDRIVFEITEREAIQDIGRMSSFLKGLKEAGFRFAIDDFGSGYASFLYLKYLPVDFLKIEGEFIKSMKRSHVDRIFVKSMVEVAKGLGIKTVAEYVEDVETIDILLDLGIDYAQGYYIGKPGPAEEKLRNFFSKG